MHKRWGIIIVFLSIFLCYNQSNILASTSKIEPRRILALFDSNETSVIKSNIHGRLEMPLNRLGLMVDYLDITKDKLIDTSKYRGILIWFNDQKMQHPAMYLKWLLKQLNNNQRVVLIGSLGAETNMQGKSVDEHLYTQVLNAMGLSYGKYGDLIDPIRVQYHNLKEQKNLFDYETKLPPQDLIYHDIRPSGFGMQAWRITYLKDIADSQAIAIGVGKRGGFISEPNFAYRVFEAPQWQISWDLNPFIFLEAAFNTQNLPKADVTTITGCRVAFSHIDGDGMANKSINLPGRQRISPEVCYDEILKTNTYPITIGLVACRIDKNGLVHNQLDVFKNIMQLPHVQPTAHGYCHPMNWAKHKVGIKYPHYIYSDYLETVGAIKLVEKLTVPKNKKAQVFLWTGDCDPTEAQIALLRKNGYLNLNGGNSRYDAIYNSRATIAPLTVAKGKELQIYAPAGNEYLYTNGWHQDKGGFVHILDTFKNTASPRLIALNLYYHFYICENQAGLNSLKKIYAWLSKQELNWIDVADYCRMVLDFTSLKIYRLSDDNSAWQFKTNGYLKTIRFDNETRAVDMQKSKGVLGWDYFCNSLYVSINAKNTKIYLSANPKNIFSLKKSTHNLLAPQLTKHNFLAKIKLFCKSGLFEFRSIHTPTVYLNNKQIKTNFKNGIYSFKIPADKVKIVELKIGF